MKGSRLFYLYLVMAVVLFALMLAGAAPVLGLEAGPQPCPAGPCLIRCFLNFAAFFIAPVLLAAFVIYLDFRHKHRDGGSSAD